MSLPLLLVVVLVILLFAGGPYTGWHTFGWGPSGIVGILLIVLIILLLMGRI